MGRRLLRLWAIALALLLASAAAAAAAPRLDGEFAIPESELSGNNKIAAGPDGNMWVTLASGKDVARITPGGQVTEYDLEATNPLGITTGPEGRIWITENGGVRSFLPSDPEGTDQLVPVIQVLNNHAIVTGPDGNLWVATENLLVRVTPAGEAQEYVALGLTPKDIDVAGSLLAVASQERILTATPTDPPVTTDYPIEGSSQGVAGGPSGRIAFSDPLASPEQVGQFTPPEQPQARTLEGDPFGVAFGADGAFWIAQAGPPEALARLTPDGQLSSLGGFQEGFNPRQIAAGPGNTLWVTLENVEGGDRVARISGVETIRAETPPVPPDTRIGRAPKKKTKTRRRRARVKFRFSSETAGATFECALSRRGKGAPAPRPRFRSCRSPKVYRLAPGRYRFMARAVAGGLVDPTPAKRFFRVVRRR
jgi:virginiamycin B lyase